MKAHRAWQSPVVWLPPRPSHAADSDLVFPGLRDSELSDMSVLQVLKKRKLGWTPHGCRAAFRSWVSATGASSEVGELQLAHTPDKLTQAYQRDDLIPQRRALVMAWKALIESDPAAQTPATVQEALVETDVAALS
jgi:integrase